MENINNEEERVIEQVEFETEDGQKILMSVIEETTIAGALCCCFGFFVSFDCFSKGGHFLSVE